VFFPESTNSPNYFIMRDDLKDKLGECYAFADIAFEDSPKSLRVELVLEFYDRLTKEQKEEFKKRIS
jgi:hypothetical protein